VKKLHVFEKNMGRKGLPLEKDMVYFTSRAKRKVNKVEKLGVPQKAAERNVFSNPLNLMWLVPTEGSKKRKQIKPFLRGRLF